MDSHGHPVVRIIILIAIICIYFYLRAALKNEKWWSVRILQKQKGWLTIQKGDSQSKITSIVGKPDYIEDENKDSEKVTWVYDCGSEGKRAITFRDGFIEKIEVKY